MCAHPDFGRGVPSAPPPPLVNLMRILCRLGHAAPRHSLGESSRSRRSFGPSCARARKGGAVAATGRVAEPKRKQYRTALAPSGARIGPGRMRAPRRGGGWRVRVCMCGIPARRASAS